MHVAYRFKKAVSYYFYGMVDKNVILMKVLLTKVPLLNMCLAIMSFV